ncbi:MAG: FKBP-type peptidyl-prolyl cis-trans isomerase [Crocinitomicaceae bacterium]|nr:FKBP-type peptidyl-prolyl cis-trans isomerase [Crocinitomicaceae bacterium]
MSNSQKDASYCVGLSVGYSLQNQDLSEINMDEFVNGMKDVFEQKQARFTPQQANQIIQAYLNEQGEAKYAANKKEGEDFLKLNAARKEVVTLPSGLQYEIISEGSGPKPTADSEVTVHYHGTLTNGTVFDSSVMRNQPATFGVTQVIKGWTEALQLMPKGSKWKLFIPENLAYGANPHPNGPIKPYMALVFEVELLEID